MMYSQHKNYFYTKFEIVFWLYLSKIIVHIHKDNAARKHSLVILHDIKNN